MVGVTDGWLLTPEQARAVGLTRADIRRRLRQSDWRAIRRGHYLAQPDAGVDPIHVAVRAAVRQLGDVVASFETAALLHRFAILGHPPARLFLTRPAAPGRTPAALVGAVLLPSGLPVSHCEEVEGIAATTGARTIVDIARGRPFRPAVVVADSALRGGVARSDAEAVLDRCRGWPGVRKARRVVAFADGAAETPLESIGRVMMLDEGLPRPRLQVTLGDAQAPMGRADFLFEEQRTIGEADGRLKYNDPAALYAEKLREDDLRDLGMEFVRFGWDDALRRGAATAARFRRAFARAARRRAVLV